MFTSSACGQKWKSTRTTRSLCKQSVVLAIALVNLWVRLTQTHDAGGLAGLSPWARCPSEAVARVSSHQNGGNHRHALGNGCHRHWRIHVVDHCRQLVYGSKRPDSE